VTTCTSSSSSPDLCHSRIRIHSFLGAILEQPRASLLPTPLDTLVPVVLFAIGQTFVMTSSWALGITGRFMGDYFGILKDSRVEGFPFNVLQDPMYVGSTMTFAATALWCVAYRAFPGRGHLVICG
jgi:phosphatidylethanolamine/phosphatidyl-N-methylethanolamine N-methyltransferase